MKEHKKNWKIKLGLILVFGSIPLFLFLPFIPALKLDTELKTTMALVIFVLAEVTFWGGGILLGKELFTKYKNKLNPKHWFKKNKTK